MTKVLKHYRTSLGGQLDSWSIERTLKEVSIDIPADHIISTQIISEDYGGIRYFLYVFYWDELPSKSGVVITSDKERAK
jgi:hypothetical protein